MFARPGWSRPLKFRAAGQSARLGHLAGPEVHQLPNARVTHILHFPELSEHLASVGD